MTNKIAVSSALALALVFGFGSAASAEPIAGATPYTGGETQSDTTAPGSTVSFTSANTRLLEGTEIDIDVDGPTTVTFSTAVLSSTKTTVGSDGTFSFAVNIPASAVIGSVYEGEAFGSAGDDSYTFEFTITIVGAAADGLPNTGAVETGAMLWFGVGLVALGVAAVSVIAVARRKTTG